MIRLLLAISFLALGSSAALAQGCPPYHPWPGSMQRTFPYDIGDATPGYDVYVAATYNHVICGVTFNEHGGHPREQVDRQWGHYSIHDAVSDGSGVIRITVPCPDGSISTDSAVNLGDEYVNDARARKAIRLARTAMRSCIGGSARKHGDIIIVQAPTRAECPSRCDFEQSAHHQTTKFWKMWPK